MPPADRFREAILAALGLASLLPMGCQPDPGPSATNGQFDSSGLDSAAEVSLDAGADLGDVPLADLSDTADVPLTDLGDALDADRQRIAQDELNHAALGWRVVAWALGAAGELRPALERAFDQAIAGGPPADPRGALLAGLDPDLLHAWGRLTPQETHCSDAKALREIVAVCARALFASTVPAAPAAAAPPFAAC